MCDQAFNVYVARPSGLLVKFDPPELTILAAAERDEKRAPEFLPTYPLPGAFTIDRSGRGWWDDSPERAARDRASPGYLRGYRVIWDWWHAPFGWAEGGYASDPGWLGGDL